MPSLTWEDEPERAIHRRPRASNANADICGTPRAYTVAFVPAAPVSPAPTATGDLDADDDAQPETSSASNATRSDHVTGRPAPAGDVRVVRATGSTNRPASTAPTAWSMARRTSRRHRRCRRP